MTKRAVPRSYVASYDVPVSASLYMERLAQACTVLIPERGFAACGEPGYVRLYADGEWVCEGCWRSLEAQGNSAQAPLPTVEAP